MKTIVHQDKAFIEEVLRQAKVCFVGLADTDGTPYVIPMNFGYREGTFYLHSAQEGRSISILSRNPKICISVSVDNTLVHQHPEVACSYRMKAKSVIAWGTANHHGAIREQGVSLQRPRRAQRKDLAS